MRRGRRRGKMGATMGIAQEFVENLLFVAVSGLLFLIVVIGDGSDAMESRNIFGRRDRHYRRYGHGRSR